MSDSEIMIDGLCVDISAYGIADIVHLPEVSSTMDFAHTLAERGCSSGTVVLTDSQTHGRGRGGKSWASESGTGLWFTLVERNVAPTALDLLSLRVGVALAIRLQEFCDSPIGLKWPNDVLVPVGNEQWKHFHSFNKLAGILVETRWRESRIEWVAIGVGINLKDSKKSVEYHAASLREGSSRAHILNSIIPEIRSRIHRDHYLTDNEMQEWAGFDLYAGRECIEPAIGTILGIDMTGGLMVKNSDDSISSYRTGSLVLA